MLVAGAGEEPVLLDFFVAAPGDGADASARAELVPVEVSFGDARAGLPLRRRVVRRLRHDRRGSRRRCERWGSVPLADARRARGGARARRAWRVNAAAGLRVRACWRGSCARRRRRAAVFAPRGRVLREGDAFRSARAGRRRSSASAPTARRRSTPGDIAAAVVACVGARGGLLTASDLAAYAPSRASRSRVAYRGRAVLTNPPPSARAARCSRSRWRCSTRRPAPPRADGSSTAMEARRRRTDAFVEGLAEPGFASASWPRGWARRRTSRCSTATGARAR